MSAENDLALAYHMGYDDALAKRMPDASKAQVLAPYDLAAENAALLEQMERLVTLLRNDCDIDASWDGLRRFWSIGLTEDGCLMRDRACKAEAENARLRELVARVERARRDLCDAYPDAELLNCEECPAWSECRGDLMDRMRELGVGVEADG